MHELSLSSAILDTVLRHADGRTVKVVTMRIGHMRQVVPESLEFYFGVVTKGTVCEGARLEQEVLPARFLCSKCEQEWELEFPDFRCPSCGQAEFTILSGTEFEVESIEVEEEVCIEQK